MQEAREVLASSRPALVDLFAGVGGLSLGLEFAGFHSVLHVEIEEMTARYAEYNFPLANHLSGPRYGDIRMVTAAQLQVAAQGTEIALIAGGPPCQGFSRAGLRRVEDPLNDLVLEMTRLILETCPKAFLIENVPGIKSGQFWQLEKALEMLSGRYRISAPNVLFAPDFGVPQVRQRVFILGYRDDLHVDPVLPDPTHVLRDNGDTLFALPETPSVRDAIMDLPDCDAYPELFDSDEIPYNQKPHSDYARIMRLNDELSRRRGYVVLWDETVCTNVRRTRHGPDLAAKLAELGPGETEPSSRIKRLVADGLSSTIRAGTTGERGAWSAPRPCHPTLPRVLTTRECARLQSFPDWFRFHPVKWHGNRQVGNAVPPLLAAAIGEVIMRDLKLVKSSEPSPVVERVDNLIRRDIVEAASSGLSRRKASHKVVGTDGNSRMRTRLILGRVGSLRLTELQ